MRRPRWTPARFRRVLGALARAVRRFRLPAVSEVAKTEDPFRVLVSTVLSLRTKDEVTEGASARLFRVARTPRSLAALPARRIERLIYPVAFYRTKAGRLRAIARRLLDEFGGRVPSDLDTLLAFKGVGRKTANLVVTLGYGKPGICVDTHVHRISNRLGIVRTKHPEQTEFALRKRLPREFWIPFNDLLVTWGQNVCRPISPFCSRCPISSDCPRVGVGTTR